MKDGVNGYGIAVALINDKVWLDQEEVDSMAIGKVGSTVTKSGSSGQGFQGVYDLIFGLKNDSLTGFLSEIKEDFVDVVRGCR